MSYETGIATMGRVLFANWMGAALSQAAFAFIYGIAIAAVIWRQRITASIVFGVMVGLGLFAVNVLLLRPLSTGTQNEMHVLIAHVAFALMFSLVYRAVSVPTMRELHTHQH